MKVIKTIALLAILFFMQNSFAQDVLITKEGNVLKVYEAEISNNSVFYKTGITADAAIKKIAKSDLLMIKYSDGRKLIIEEESALQAAAEAASKPSGNAPQTIDYSDNTANTDAINYWNNIDVQHLAPVSSKKANLLYCLCKLNPQSKIADKNVELTFKSSRIDHKGVKLEYIIPVFNAVKVSIKNKSTETIYVDLGKSFLIRGCESIQCYVPSATSHTSGQSIGTSVNMGAVANAMGVSGALGTLANGVNVGGGKSSSATTTTFAQRVVPVPPMSEKEIGTLHLFPAQSTEIYNLKYKMNHTGIVLYVYLDNIPFVGDNLQIDNNNLMNFSALVTYSMDEQQSNPQNLNARFSFSNIIGTKATAINRALDQEALSPNWDDAVYFLAYPKKE